jgi:hypothetical protein
MSTVHTYRKHRMAKNLLMKDLIGQETITTISGKNSFFRYCRHVKCSCSIHKNNYRIISLLFSFIRRRLSIKFSPLSSLISEFSNHCSIMAWPLSDEHKKAAAASHHSDHIFCSSFVPGTFRRLEVVSQSYKMYQYTVRCKSNSPGFYYKYYHSTS